MATFQLPAVAGLRAYEFEVDLEGTTYRLAFNWNERDACYYADVFGVDGTEIARGRRVVADWPLLRGVTKEGRPLGELFALDPRGAGTEPGVDELGGDVPLLYVESSGVE